MNEETAAELSRLKEDLERAQKAYDDFVKSLGDDIDESIGGGIKNPK